MAEGRVRAGEAIRHLGDWNLGSSGGSGRTLVTGVRSGGAGEDGHGTGRRRGVAPANPGGCPPGTAWGRAIGFSDARAASHSCIETGFRASSPEELERLASDLAEIILTTNPADEDRIATDARMALLFAALQYDEGWGTPYAGAYDQLVRVYETLVARALENGGTDPFKEMYRLDEAEPGGRPRYAQLSMVLRSIFAADPERRGADYVVALIEASEPPESGEYNAPAPTLWCKAANALYQFGDGRLTLMREVAGDEKFILSRCNKLGWTSVFYE